LPFLSSTHYPQSFHYRPHHAAHISSYYWAYYTPNTISYYCPYHAPVTCSHVYSYYRYGKCVDIDCIGSGGGGKSMVTSGISSRGNYLIVAGVIVVAVVLIV